MSRLCVIELGYLTEKIVHNEVIKTHIFKKRYALRKSIRSKEFYDSATLGLKPEVCFEVNNFEFNDAVLLKYKKQTYSIIRTYAKSDEKIELYVEKFGGDVNDI